MHNIHVENGNKCYMLKNLRDWSTKQIRICLYICRYNYSARRIKDGHVLCCFFVCGKLMYSLFEANKDVNINNSFLYVNLTKEDFDTQQYETRVEVLVYRDSWVLSGSTYSVVL